MNVYGNAENITTFEQHIAIDLITTRKLEIAEIESSVLMRDRQDLKAFELRARFTVACHSGARVRSIYIQDNPDGAVETGLQWLGERLPSCQYESYDSSNLPLSSSCKIAFDYPKRIRGKGGHLLLPDGTRSCLNSMSEQSLPTRSVARAIDHE